MRRHLTQKRALRLLQNADDGCIPVQRPQHRLSERGGLLLMRPKLDRKSVV